MKTAIVLGAGGFIGAQLSIWLANNGYHVRGVDLRKSKYSAYPHDFIIGDLKDPVVVSTVIPEDVDEVYQLAADMGGAGYIFSGENDAEIFSNNAFINLNVANVALKKRVKKLFFSSSACVYAKEHQGKLLKNKLSENMAYPANPDSDYGWEKLMSERIYQAYNRNFGLNIRIARFHNIYGPMSDFYTGRDKAPAATCRKVICAKDHVEVWGSGRQLRTFLYIDDCLDAISALMRSDCVEPLNIGSEESISINDLTKMVIEYSSKELSIKNIDGPIGVNARSSDNTKINIATGWKPRVSLEDGMKKMYDWVNNQITIMPFIYEDDGNGGNRRFINEKDQRGKYVTYYF